ncbi:MAG: carboxylating nicotinate-nucleotide diphosphorylase [Armatimonadetes bacterium]|nr:carboxylating nicotinate-nucleotide diphosphorylase [Armatimonadota bacterium]
MNLNMLDVERIVRRALEEDIGTGDITTTLTIPPGSISHAKIIAKEPGIIAGLHVAALVFELVARSYGSDIALKVTSQVGGEPTRVRFRASMLDGSEVNAGDTIAEIEGDTAVILTGERTALNFLQRMSGIATKTSRLVKLIAHTKAHVVDTRKTTPGMRMLEKYAVRMGGGQNHRFGLYDAILIKDNHILAAGGIEKAIHAARAGIPHTVKIEVEADTLEQVRQALDAGADMILLDNMSLDMLRQAVTMCSGRALTEASGGITEETIAKIAETGVDLISVGALTHSVQALDLSLDIV